MKTTTINGFYGASHTPCEILLAQNGYSTWYAVKGSRIANKTYQEVADGVDVEEIEDIDCFTWSAGIDSEEELINAIES